MNLFASSLLAVAMVSAATTARADAVKDLAQGSQGAFIQEFDNTLAPLQFVKFCMNYRDECDADSSQQTLPAAERTIDMLRQVNTAVNEGISPVHKSTDPMLAHWTLSPTAGDCNDYAVTKRHKLIAKGWPAADLRLAVVLTEQGEGHLVLVARLPDGDVVLDNLSSFVRQWSAPHYEWISMQSGSNPRFWVTVGQHGRRLQARRLEASALPL